MVYKYLDPSEVESFYRNWATLRHPLIHNSQNLTIAVFKLYRLLGVTGCPQVIIAKSIRSLTRRLATMDHTDAPDHMHMHSLINAHYSLDSITSDLGLPLRLAEEALLGAGLNTSMTLRHQRPDLMDCTLEDLDLPYDVCRYATVGLYASPGMFAYEYLIAKYQCLPASLTHNLLMKIHRSVDYMIPFTESVILMPATCGRE